MVDNETEVTNPRIDGHISGPIEVILEDDKQEFIEKSSIYIHSSRSEQGDDGDPLFVNIDIGAACVAGGFFKTVITKKMGNQIFRKSSGLSQEDCYQILGVLFPVDDGVLELSDEGEVDLQDKYQLSAKLQVHYNENDEVVNDKLIVAVKTRARIPVTVGSIDLEPIEIKDEETENEDHQEDLFDWLELTTFQYKSMISHIKRLNTTIEKLRTENFKLNTYYDQCKSDYESIIQDLETKFYQLLNSKKDYIWQLTQEINKTKSGNDINGGKIIGLNEKFMEKQGKLQVIDRSKIQNDLDKKFIRKRKEITRKKDLPNKRRKPMDESEENEEIEVKRDYGDATDEDEESKKLEDGLIEVKKEGNEFKFDPSLEIKDDSSSNSDKFEFSRRLRSDRQIVDEALKSDTENEEKGYSDAGEEINDDSHHEGESGSQTDGDDDDDGDYEEQEDQAEDKDGSYGESVLENKLEVNEKGSLSQTSNEVIADSLPDRQLDINQSQGQETDYSESDQDKEEEKEQHAIESSAGKSQSQIETDYEDSDGD